jgi:CRISPR/Cas system-associated exonuclease Cas4 (RecB family)
VPVGFIWYSVPRRRWRVDLDERLREATERGIAEIRDTVASGVLPLAVDDARCNQCPLADHCLPSLTSAHGIRRVTRYVAAELYTCGC